MRRSSNWMTLFDSATGWIAPRDPDGAFMQTPITENGQSGFQEGNAAQYTWMVPQDLARPRRRDGRHAQATLPSSTRSSRSSTPDKTNRTRGWATSRASARPWVYLIAGAPWRAQEIVRRRAHDALRRHARRSPRKRRSRHDERLVSCGARSASIRRIPRCAISTSAHRSSRRLRCGPRTVRRSRSAPRKPRRPIHTSSSFASTVARTTRVGSTCRFAACVRLDYVLGPSPNPPLGQLSGGRAAVVRAIPCRACALNLGSTRSRATSLALAPGAQTPLRFATL